MFKGIPTILVNANGIYEYFFFFALVNNFYKFCEKDHRFAKRVKSQFEVRKKWTIFCQVTKHAIDINIDECLSIIYPRYIIPTRWNDMSNCESNYWFFPQKSLWCLMSEKVIMTPNLQIWLHQFHWGNFKSKVYASKLRIIVKLNSKWTKLNTFLNYFVKGNYLFFFPKLQKQR